MEYLDQTKELLRYCVATYFAKKRYPISKTTLLKILYKCKKTIPDDYPMKNNLQFYWYEHGPTSPPLLALKDLMVNNNILRQDERERLFTDRPRIYGTDDVFATIRENVNKIIDESASASSMTMIEDLYLTDAPYPFYISFKSRFRASLHNFYNDPSTNVIPEKIITILHETIGDLPNEPLFSNFKYIFLDFVDLFFEVAKTKNKELGQELNDLSYDIFKTFVKGVRILYHDPYFENEVENWNEIFSQSQIDVDNKIRWLYQEAQNIGVKNIHCLRLDELIEEIIKLKMNEKLVTVSFMPPIMDEDLNYGQLDASIFNNMDDKNLKQVLNKFNLSKKAIIHTSNKNNLDVTKYKIITS